MTLKDAQLYDLFHISHQFLYLKQVKGASLVYQNTRFSHWLQVLNVCIYVLAIEAVTYLLSCR